MTKSELINRFSKTIGLSESDAKPFFELLLKRISEELKSGQSIFIPEFGYFHLIKGRIKLPSTELESEGIDEEKIDIILYSETEKLGESEANGFVFNIPVFEEDEFNQIDSHFSLSIDKPLIPLLGVLDQKTYIPKSAQDQRRYLESKIEQIIANSKVVVSEEEFPTLIIDASSYNSDHINLEKAKDELESLLSDELTEKSVDEEKDEKAAKNIAWDFGDFYTKKISAESVFQLAHQIISNPPVEKQNTKNNVKELEGQNKEENLLDKLLENESDNEIVTENLKESNSEEIDPPEITTSETELKITDKKENETNTFRELNPEFSEEDMKEDVSDEEFWKSTSKLFETYNPRELRTEHNDEFSELMPGEVKENEIEKDAQKIELAPEIQETEETIEEELESKKDEGAEPGSEFKSDKKSNKRWLLFVVPLILILAFAAYYFYNQIKTKNQIQPENKELSLNSDNANVIQRDFEIPVTYPYPSKNEISKEDSTENQNPVNLEKQPADDKTPAIKNSESNGSKNQLKNSDQSGVPEGKPISLGNNIYRYGNIYVVQVAAFRSKSIAENEAGKYRNKGFNSFVEQVEIPGRGLWYRIKVGNFSKFEEASNFISKKR